MKIKIGRIYWLPRPTEGMRCEIPTPAFVVVTSVVTTSEDKGIFIVADLKDSRREAWVREKWLHYHRDPSVASEIEILENRLEELREPRKPEIGEVWKNPGSDEFRIITRGGSVSIHNGSVWGSSYPIDNWDYVGLASEVLAVKP